MSNLTSTYEISTWVDVWDGSKFVEQKECVIGSDTMLYQGRVIEPNFVRNVNGQKKLSFKMYKKFVDNITGEKVDNPFSNMLVNETKVKLHYEGKWYDFYVKNIVENSSTYLYTYQLEDVWVQELSKNGYGVTLDEEKRNNLGTVKTLAETVMEGTDWKVVSEAFVEKVEESLVYLRVNKDISATRLLDQSDSALDEGLDTTTATIPNNSTILGFYSSCQNRPHRFQFIYVPTSEEKQLKDGYIINNDNCQYYIDIPKPLNGGYNKVTDNGSIFYLPDGFLLEVNDLNNDTTISNKYKAKRYGFAQETEYVPVLETYCKKFKKNGVDYYGYLDSNIASPVFTNNIITNSEFKGITGWAATSKGSSRDCAPEIENVYGQFQDNKFVSALEQFKDGTFSSGNTESYASYLHVSFKSTTSSDGVLFNTGPKDRRFDLGSIQENDEWIMEYEAYDKEGKAGSFTHSGWSVTINDVSYNSDTTTYDIGSPIATFSNGWIGDDTFFLCKFINLPADYRSEDSFQKKNLRLVIRSKPEAGNDGARPTEFYLKNILLYKKVLNAEGNLIKPGNYTTPAEISNNYVFVREDDTKEDSLNSSLEKIIIAEKELNYNTWVPVYNTNGQKIRTVSIKESNYFNVLQSIAERFECWLEIDVQHESDGSIKYDNYEKPLKFVRFKNYAGNTNYAAFRYGVNLKDIQRTYESKQLVSNLIVKPNNNKLAKDGSCTIARAGSNQTGETNIYDFQYYIKQQLLNSRDFVASMYYHTNPDNEDLVALGKDVDEEHATTNLQNYFNRIKVINQDLEPINEEIQTITTELISLEAKQAEQQALLDAANSGLEESTKEFYTLTSIYPHQTDEGLINEISCTGVTEDDSYNTYSETITWTKPTGLNDSPIFQFTVDFINTDNYNEIQDLKIETYGDTATIQVIEYGYNYTDTAIDWAYSGLKVSLIDANQNPIYYTEGNCYELSFTITPGGGGELKNIGSHMSSFVNCEILVGEDRYFGKDRVSLSKYSKDNPLDIKIRGIYKRNAEDNTPYLFIQPNRGLTEYINCNITNIKLKQHRITNHLSQLNYWIEAHFSTKVEGKQELVEKDIKFNCPLPAYSLRGTTRITVPYVEYTNSVNKTLEEYLTYIGQAKQAELELSSIKPAVQNKKNFLLTKKNERQKKIDQKKTLNNLFSQTYSRFIQEGTWMSEEYVDDNKYYNDALVTLYNSCYPQVAYNIQTIAINRLPGYEGFTFGLGDTTYAEDPEFFGSDLRTEVVVTEISENLDDASKSTIKVQNFKNQFQDLFQRITATVQETKYNTGAYKKAVELTEAEAEIRGKFVADGLAAMAESLSIAGQTTVVQDASGITLTDSATQNQMRLIGGAILMNTQDPDTGERKWKTGLTPDGITASLVTAGRLNTGEISIMNANDITFKWDSFGITAFDADWSNGAVSGDVDLYKFIRFDKHGIYGINSNYNSNSLSINGDKWVPTSVQDIDDNATFALTWEGLKVTGNNQGVIRFGKNSNGIMTVYEKNKEKPSFEIANDGSVTIRGSLRVTGDGNKEEDFFELYKDFVGDYNEFVEGYNSFSTNIQTQIDGKAESHYCADDPATYINTVTETAWGKNNVGDLWRYSGSTKKDIPTSTKDTTNKTIYPNAEFVWKAMGEDEYGWHEMEIPNVVFDAYDGKATIYVTIESADTAYENSHLKAGDLLILSNDGSWEKTAPKITIKGNTVYRWDGKTWKAADAIDAEKVRGALGLADGAKINTDQFVYKNETKTITNVNGEERTITETVVYKKDEQGKEQEISRTIEGGGFVATNVGSGGDSYCLLESDGVLQANNAIIHGTIFANAGQIGGMTIGDVTDKLTSPNPNLLPFSNFVSGETWEGWGKSKNNSCKIYLPAINNGKENSGGLDNYDTNLSHDGQQSICVFVTNQELNSGGFQWNGLKSKKDVGISFSEGEKVTFSCWCKIDSMEGTTANGTKNCVGISLRGTPGNNPTSEKIYDEKVEYGDTRVGEGWFRLSKTITIEESGLNNCYVYLFLANNGKVFFSEVKIEKGSAATPWVAKDTDFYCNLTDYSKLSEGTITAYQNENKKFVDWFIKGYLPGEDVSLYEPYYFVADVEPKWANGLADKYKYITLGFWSQKSDNTYALNTNQNYPIINGRVSGLLPLPRFDIDNDINADHFIIYCGVKDHTAGNVIKFSNIRIYRGTVAPGHYINEVAKGQYSWDFSTSKGITMWNKNNGTDEKVFSVADGQAYFNGEIIANAGNIAGWSIESHAMIKLGSEVKTTEALGVEYRYFDNCFGVNFSDNGPILAAGKFFDGYSWQSSNIEAKDFGTAMDGAGFRVYSNGEIYATSGTIAGFAFDDKGFSKTEYIDLYKVTTTCTMSVDKISVELTSFGVVRKASLEQGTISITNMNAIDSLLDLTPPIMNVTLADGNYEVKIEKETGYLKATKKE